MSKSNGTSPDADARFGGVARLYGSEGLARLRSARVLVVGIGGVGCWAAEALARMGVGTLHLVDLDEVCLSNVNRQLHALEGTVGQSKVAVMAARIRAINPAAAVVADARFFTTGSAEVILGTRPDAVVDAIDNLRNKALLIAECVRRGLPVVTSAGAGGRRDPLQVQETDLALTRDDALAAQLRKRLRQHHQFPRERRRKFHVPCIYSMETPFVPQADGSVCARVNPGEPMALNCDHGYGTSTAVVGAFGFAIAAAVIGGTSLFGGRGKVQSALFGALVIGSLANGMGLLGWSAGVQAVVTGIVLVIAVLLDSLSRRAQKRAGLA